MHSPLGDSRLLPVGPLLYREELGDALVSFQADSGGRIVRGFFGPAPMMTMERVPFSQSVTLHWIILGLGVLVFVGMVLAAIGRFVRRRFGEARREDVLPGRWLLVTASALQIVFVIAVVVIASASGGGFLNGPLTSLKVALALPVIGTICVLGAVYFAIAAVAARRGDARGAASLQRGDVRRALVHVVADAVEFAGVEDVSGCGGGVRGRVRNLVLRSACTAPRLGCTRFRARCHGIDLSLASQSHSDPQPSSLACMLTGALAPPG